MRRTLLRWVPRDTKGREHPAAELSRAEEADFKDFSASHEVVPLSDTGVASAWQRLLARLAREPRPRRQDDSPPRRPWWGATRIAHALSAVLLALVMGLGVWIAGLRAELRRLGAPQVNPPIWSVNLTAGGDTPELLELPAAAERFALSLIVPAREPAPEAWRLEIATLEGREVWSGEGLQEARDGTFGIDLSRRFLPVGDYRLRLLGRDGSRWQVIGERIVRVMASAI